MKKILVHSFWTASLLAVQLPVFGQGTKVKVDEAKKIGAAQKSAIFEAELVGKKNAPTADLDWIPTLSSKCEKVKHGLPGEEEMKALKAEKLAHKTMFRAPGTGEEEADDDFAGSTPVVGEEFVGNPNNGSSPMDNSIAISDGGIIVSVANTTIEYNTMGGMTTYNNSIVDFIDDIFLYLWCNS